MINLCAVSEKGIRLGGIISQKLGGEIFKYLAHELGEINKIPREYRVVNSLKEFARRFLPISDTVIFICDCPNAVMAISDYIKECQNPPAVVVIDEEGRFCIALLGGKTSGVNLLTQRIASLINAQPILTTPSDNKDCFSVEDWAEKSNLYISDLGSARAFTTALLAGEKFSFTSDYIIMGNISNWKYAFQYDDNASKCGICISHSFSRLPYETNVCLHPKNLVMGINVAGGLSSDFISRTVKRILENNGLNLKCINLVCAMDSKSWEHGLNEFTQKNKLRLNFYPPAQLYSTTSNFNEKLTNSCESLAVCGAKGGHLVLRKVDDSSVSIAVAETDFIVNL